jgi:hypothetical protein
VGVGSICSARVIGRILVVVAVVLVAVGLVGCGGSRSPSDEIPAVRVEAVFKVGSRLGDMFAAGPVVAPDSGRYAAQCGVWRGSPEKTNLASDPTAWLYVYRADREARRDMAAITDNIRAGNGCENHHDPRSFTTWTTCERLRVGNVLLVMGAADDLSEHTTPADRRALVAVLSKLGTPPRIDGSAAARRPQRLRPKWRCRPILWHRCSRVPQDH